MAVSVRIDGTRPTSGDGTGGRVAWRRAAIGFAAAIVIASCVGTGGSTNPTTAATGGTGPGGASPTRTTSGPTRTTSGPTRTTSGPTDTTAGTGAPTARPGTPTADVTSPPSPAVADLLAELRTSTDWSVRLAAAEALAAEPDASVQNGLEAALKDANLDVRTAVAEALGERGNAHAVKALAAALTAEVGSEPGSTFIGPAATALGKLGGSGGVTALIAVLRAGAGDGRKAALKAFGAVGAPAVSPLQKLLTNSDVDVRLDGVDGLYAVGKPAVAALVKALANSEAKVRSRAATDLGHLNNRSAEAGLAAMLDDPPTGGGNSASVALARLYADAPAKLLHYLTAKKTIRIYYGLVFVGASETEKALANALLRLGDLEMAEFFLNCGSSTLEQSAHDWADAHGYTVISIPGSSDRTWGSGLPD